MPSILNTPIFRLNVDDRTKQFDESWFDQTVVPTFQADKAQGFLPVAHVGHTNPEGDSQERPRVAFMDNLRRVGKEVFCDFIEIPDAVLPILKDNLFPNRSVEMRVDGKGFASVALLGATEPHFKLAQENPLVDAQFKAVPNGDGNPKVLQFEAADISLTDALEVQQLEEHSWKIDSALWSKLWDIKNSESMTADEKKAAIEAAMQEWLGLAAQVQKDIVDITDGVTAPAQFKAVDQRDAHFRAREAALIERENKIIRDELLQAGLAIPVVDNFLALRKHIPDEDKTIQFKAGDKVESITPRAGFEHFLRDVANRFQAGTLAVETKPIPVSTVTDDPVADRQQSDAVRETKAIEQFMADQKITNFAEARRAFLASEAGQKFRAAIA